MLPERQFINVAFKVIRTLSMLMSEMKVFQRERGIDESKLDTTILKKERKG